MTPILASPTHRRKRRVAWRAALTCGVCGLSQELGIDAEEEVVDMG